RSTSTSMRWPTPASATRRSTPCASGPRSSNGSATASRSWRASTGVPLWCATARSWWPSSIRSSPATAACTSSSSGDANRSAMSGHSKWGPIKHKKGAADAKRGKLFAKLIRQVEVAARNGGGDPDMNPTLRTMFQKARDASVPLDTIERAIKRGTGELEGVTYEEVTYDGYGPGGVAVMVDALTDNRNRTGAEVRSIFTKHGGSMAE